MADTFTVDGQNYRVGMMDPRIQLLVLKRLMRFVPALTKSDRVLARIKIGELPEPEEVLDTVTALGPLIAETPDADFDFVCDACMKITRHLHEGKAFPVMTDEGVVSNQSNKMPMRKLKIVGNVLRVTFAPMMTEIAPAIGVPEPVEGVV